MKKIRFALPGNIPKIILWMKLTSLLLLINLTSFATSDYSPGDNVTVKSRDSNLKEFFSAVENQTSYKLYSDDAVGDRVIAPLTLLQQQRITGRVTDNSGDPLPGVNVVVTGTTTGVLTDLEGRYTIDVPQGSKSLTFSFIGMEPQEIVIGTSTQINVTMDEYAVGLDEVVVIGYGVQRKRDLTGSIASISTEEISKRVATNAIEAIQGQLAGVQITSASGAPGDDSFVRIRGISTLGGGVTPLYIVDGQPMDNIQSINPNDISSLEILKDGASAAIYGSKSANGVVIITTKSGQVDQSQINVGYIRSYKTTRIMPVNTTNGRLDYEVFHNMIGHRRDLDTLNQQFYNNNNFQEMAYRTAKKDQLNIGISAGTNKTKVYWNTALLNEEGVIVTTNFMRLNTRLNVDQVINERITMGMRTALSFDNTKNIDQSYESGLIGQLLTKAPFSTLYDIDGSFLYQNNSYRGRENFLQEYTLMDSKKRNIRGNLFNYVEINVIEGLKLRTNFAVDYNLYRFTEFFPPHVRAANSTIRANYFSSLDWSVLAESYANYDKIIGVS
jgi:TonB-dependent starch-binding outer membrane protein SusC